MKMMQVPIKKRGACLCIAWTVHAIVQTRTKNDGRVTEQQERRDNHCSGTIVTHTHLALAALSCNGPSVGSSLWSKALASALSYSRPLEYAHRTTKTTHAGDVSTASIVRHTKTHTAQHPSAMRIGRKALLPPLITATPSLLLHINRDSNDTNGPVLDYQRGHDQHQQQDHRHDYTTATASDSSGDNGHSKNNCAVYLWSSSSASSSRSLKPPLKARSGIASPDLTLSLETK